jgi:hypothetical protein
MLIQRDLEAEKQSYDWAPIPLKISGMHGLEQAKKGKEVI